MSSPTASSPLAQPPSLPPPSLDLSSLTDDEAFTSESDWLNDLLSSSLEQGDASSPSLAALDSKLARTLGSLEVATHDTSALVDRTIDEISRSVPRLTFDLQLMRENALLLQFTLNAIRTRSGSGTGEDSEVNKVMEKLRVLDLVKSRMEAARDVLREAESWSTLESEVTGLVGEQAYGKAAERLEEAARSMVVFQNTAEYEGRRALMVSLQNQLEASLSASLVAAINSRDVKACKTFYSIFGQIQREAEFTAYYFGSRRSALVEAWSSVNLEDCAEAPKDPLDPLPPPIKLTTFLAKFYGDLHSLLAEERSYVPAIFPDPVPILSSFVQTTLEGLTPSLPQRLTAIADRHGPLVLPELIQAYRSTEEFAVSVERIIAKLGLPASPGPGSTPSPGTPSKKTRRLSQRMSVSKRLGSRSISFGSGQTPGFFGNGEDTVRAWETAIFEPFLDWQTEYPELERQFLASEMARETGGRNVMEYLVKGGSAKGARELWELTLSIYTLMEDAIGRSMALTHGYGAVGLVEVIDSQLVYYMERRRVELMNARKGGSTREAGRPMNQDDDEAVLEGLEYSTEDWTTFQFGLRLLDTCRSMTEKLTSFEGKLHSRLTGLAQTIRDAREDPVGYTIPGTTRGAVTMLRQSTLNSADLVTLLEPLEKPQDHPTPALLLPKARNATSDFTRATQLFLHDTILAPLLTHLAEYSTLPSWTTTSDQRPGGKGAFDLAIPTFSLSPTETISRVGEGLFNLPRLFEVYADDDALAFSIETLPFVDADSLHAMQTPPGTAGPPGHRISESLSTQPPGSPSLARRPPAPTPSTSTPLSAETVIATWLSSLTLSVLNHLTTTVLPGINRLSRHGASQLVSDLDYISNVARALDVESPEDLEAWRDAAALEDKDKAVAEGVSIDRVILERVAKIRGWRKAAV